MLDKSSRERFRLIYESHYARILGYAVRRVGSAEDAADIVAETFATCWRRFDDMPQGEEGKLWLYGVARHLLANHHRREIHRRELIDMLAADYEEAILWDALPAEAPVVSLAWNRLRPDDRDILGLLVWEAFSHEQIARIVGCSRPVVKLRIHRARRRLARELTRVGIEVKPRGTARHVVVGGTDALDEKEGLNEKPA